ncbi:hypothetical protein DACRYDRAFT_21509 [Dacryopinax primogenitus]|uniref:Uncharacterized protein n=1 Tax=Dacryopinax primogenitus (strain DJM 731) TaxID=1858805 RepID=M5G3P3_DACPD|nr:uncharacterized protein DACRYDRAFT_21509 [Dacryopinax primogenitus]EJU03294.1 hypothetical protein DACRYDRAFT_21509 [Dacryopinax primogenitus]
MALFSERIVQESQSTKKHVEAMMQEALTASAITKLPDLTTCGKYSSTYFENITLMGGYDLLGIFSSRSR